jgi:hypothetical protein
MAARTAHEKMIRPPASESVMVSKIRRLSPERLSELEATIDRMLEAQEDLALQEFGQSQDVLARIWDNPDDAEYDRL